MIKNAFMILVALLLSVGAAPVGAFADGGREHDRMYGTRAGCSKENLTEIKKVVTALYAGISFLPGTEPDWSGIKSLFISGGRLIPPKMPGEAAVAVMDVDTFIVWAKMVAEQTGLGSKGFYEREIASVTECFGNIAHVFSTYETRNTAGDPEPFERGINSIQLLLEDGRWKVVTIMWDIETENKPIPRKYLMSKPLFTDL